MRRFERERAFLKTDFEMLKGVKTGAASGVPQPEAEKPAVFEYGHFDYIQEHLRILSAFYGSLKPMDGVTPYRLEMQSPSS